MSSTTISVELDPRNLLWLKGRALASGSRSMSDVVNELIARARAARQEEAGPVPSIKGTIEISEDDPSLEGADAAIRALFSESLDRFPPGS
jgi:predicted CopG family antitoxin